MFNDWAFLPMRASNELMGDPGALRERLQEDSYLYFERLIDPDKITALRKDILLALHEQGWVQRHPFFMQAITVIPPVREGDDEFFRGYDAVQRLESLHALAHDESLVGLMRQVRGETGVSPPAQDRPAELPGPLRGSHPPAPGLPQQPGHARAHRELDTGR